MTVEVGGAGTLGLAFETVLGTYAAPTKWIPIRSESLQLVEDKVYRTNIRGLADRSGAIQGYQHVEGDVEFEVTSDALLYFLYAARVTPSKSGTGPYTYTFTPAHVAKASTGTGPATRKTLSILVTRGGNPMGYLGCSVGQLAFSLDNGVLMCTASIVGVNAESQSASTPTWPSSVPYGPGKVSLEYPSTQARADVDTFSCTINDNLSPANRLNGTRFAAYQNWGERELTASYEADFDTLTDYNIFVNQTIQDIILKGVNNSSNDSVEIELHAAVVDSYQVGLSSLGDVVRASVELHGIYSATDLSAYTITVKTTENIT